MVTFVAALTGEVETVKVAEVAPCGTETLAGTVATAVFEEDSVTTTPPWPAAAVSVAVPVAVLPPRTAPGETLIVERRTGAATAAAARNNETKNADTRGMEKDRFTHSLLAKPDTPAAMRELRISIVGFQDRLNYRRAE